VGFHHPVVLKMGHLINGLSIKFKPKFLPASPTLIASSLSVACPPLWQLPFIFDGWPDPITCAEITIVMVYFQLCYEDYHWWWRSFFVSGVCPPLSFDFPSE
jgi:hypothetical protein